MVNVNELKRDNYLFQKSRGIAVQIDNSYGLHHITAWGVDWPIEDFENIILTPELLVQQGFTPDFDGRNKYYIIPGKSEDTNIQHIQLLDDGKVILLDQDFAQIGIPFMYLHLLQSAYFFLTGQELPIKEFA